jgi:hypothetical protein
VRHALSPHGAQNIVSISYILITYAFYIFL